MLSYIERKKRGGHNAPFLLVYLFQKTIEMHNLNIYTKEISEYLGTFVSR